MSERPHAMLRSLYQVAVFSSDLDRSVAFYRDVLGADFLATFDPPGLAFLRVGETRILLEKNGMKSTLYFRVDNIHDSYRRLQERGVTFLREPHSIYRDDQGLFGDAGETEWMAFLMDPDENLLAIVARVAG